MRDTGSPRADAESDFLRARRQYVMSSVASRFRSDGDERGRPMSFDEVTKALGVRGERHLGLLVIPLARIVGSVDKVRDFDRFFRPTSNRSRARWERIAQASRRGEEIPPIDVYKLGDLYFVRDGHHRVSVAKALGLDVIEANVTEMLTSVSPEGVNSMSDLSRKHWRRIFLERVPLTGQARADLDVTDPDDYHRLAEMIEAWACRRMHHDGAYMDKSTMAQLWYDEEFQPVLKLIDDVGLREPGETPADAYLRIACERYEVSREHVWDRDVMEQLKEQPRRRRR